MAPFRPWIGIEQIDPADRCRRQPIEQFDRVGMMQADVGKRLGIDCRKRLGDAIDERLGPDEADARIGLGARDQVLGPAEADFKVDVVDG
jgi:hypothetical protein